MPGSIVGKAQRLPLHGLGNRSSSKDHVDDYSLHEGLVKVLIYGTLH